MKKISGLSPSGSVSFAGRPLSGHLGCASQVEPEFLQLVLNRAIDYFLTVNFGWFIPLHFKHGGDNFPALFPAMDFEPVFDQLGAIFGARHRNENPFIPFESMEGFKLPVGNADRMRIIIHSLDPGLLAHRTAGVV